MNTTNYKVPALTAIAVATAVNLAVQISGAIYFLNTIDGFARPWLLPLAIAVEVLAFLVIAPFLWQVYRLSGVRLPFSKVAGHTLAGFSFARILAFGDYLMLRILLHRNNKPIAPAFDFIILLYSFGIISLLLLFLLAQTFAFFATSQAPVSDTSRAVSFVPVFLALLVLALFLVHRTRRVRTRVQRLFTRVFGKKADTPLTIIRRLRASPPKVLFWFGLLCLSWLLESLAFYLCILSVGLDVPYSLGLYDYTFVRIFQFLPFIPGGFGEIEAASSLVLLPYGYEAGKIITAALLFRFISFWIPFITLLLLVALAFSAKKLPRLKQ